MAFRTDAASIAVAVFGSQCMEAPRSCVFLLRVRGSRISAFPRRTSHHAALAAKTCGPCLLRPLAQRKAAMLWGVPCFDLMYLFPGSGSRCSAFREVVLSVFLSPCSPEDDWGVTKCLAAVFFPSKSRRRVLEYPSTQCSIVAGSDGGGVYSSSCRTGRIPQSEICRPR